MNDSRKLKCKRHCDWFKFSTMLIVSVIAIILRCSYEIFYYISSECHVNKLFVLQKKAIRAMHGLNFCDHTNLYFSSSSILKLKDLHYYYSCIYMFKTFNFGFDNSLLSVINSHTNIHSHNTRNSSRLVLPRFTSSKCQNSFSYVGSKCWNNLPYTVTSSNSLVTFKNRLKTLLTSSYTPSV